MLLLKKCEGILKILLYLYLLVDDELSLLLLVEVLCLLEGRGLVRGVHEEGPGGREVAVLRQVGLFFGPFFYS